ncbi:DNA modification methylase [Endozoicomonas montiporae]|uniref:site-specific DNA-methyltransferase (adenine-specific) n=1 Tax=Endozoicomonas montiporae CL-33 TaxID=570277 RepID=A0A142BHL6_9GAMM|nr:DNA modification methylase [Endozoicomonas montiporae]AMO58242.1 DNA modification methylase [Endozoicomonas montiporae CL-33]
MSRWKDRITGQGKENPEQLLANPQNWRIHPKHQQDALKGALEEIGWIQQVIVNQRTGHLIDGHLRVELSMREGETEVPVIYVDLSEDEEKIALATIDPLSAMAETDQGMLDRLLEGIDVDNDELNSLLESLASPDLLDEPEDGLTDDDDCPEPRDNTTCQPGDVWLLGSHRLMCGDGTKPEHIERLVQSELVDMVWTDPPYNVDYQGGTEDKLTIKNDKMGDAQFREFLRDLFSAACQWTKPGAPIYVAHADTEGVNFRSALQEAGFLLKQCLIWVKNTFTLGRQDYNWQHEPILYGWKPGAAHKWFGEFNKATVIDDEPDLKNMDKSELVNHCRTLRNQLNTTIVREDKPARSAEHPTMKPVALLVHMIRNSSTRQDRVLDMCGGSGSTLIACEKLGRQARIMELDPVYCDVIIKRWEQFTGKKAQRI